MGLVRVQDEAATAEWVDRVLAQEAEAVSNALANTRKAKAAVGYLRGKVMKLSSGRADPAVVSRLIEQGLKQRGARRKL